MDAAPDEAELWERLRQGADPEARERLLARHLPYARVVARHYYARRFHDEIEFGDYLQYASIGLLEALERYEPGHGAQFRTFAARRMHGAILNGLERLTEKQQQIAARERIRTDWLAGAAQAAGGRGPCASQQLGAYVAEVGLGRALAWLLEGTAMLDDGIRAECLPFYRDALLQQRRERVAQAIAALPAQERSVVRWHYLQEIPFERIAAMMDLTKGRISQIHRRALLRLRETLAELADLDLHT